MPAADIRVITVRAMDLSAEEKEALAKDRDAYEALDAATQRAVDEHDRRLRNLFIYGNENGL